MATARAARAAQAEPRDEEALVPYAIALLACCLAGGLLLAATAVLSLAWLPAQLPVLLALCYAIPLAAVFARRQQSSLGRTAAARFALQALVARLALFALVLVGAPLLERIVLFRGVSLSDRGFIVPALAAVIAAQLSWSQATALFDLWHTMRVQDWEDGAVRQPGDAAILRSGRIDRTGVMERLWRAIVAGGVLLTLALASAAVVNPSAAPPPVVAALLVVIYILTGLLFGGGAARRRLAAESRLDGLPLSAEVTRSWLPTAATTAIMGLALIALALLAQVLTVAHAALGWLWETVLAPIVAGLLGLFGHGLTGMSPQQIDHLLGRPPRPTAPPPPPPPHHEGPSALWWWLTHASPWILAAVVAIVLLRSYRAYRQNYVPGQPWWPRVVAAVLAELRRLRRAVLAPARAAASALRQRATTAARRRRRARLRGRLDERRLAPRALVILLYGRALVSLARRTSPRRLGQAPGEYAAEVGERLDAADRAAFDDLTADFLAARYGPHAIEPARAARARVNWKILTEALKRTQRL